MGHSIRETVPQRPRPQRCRQCADSVDDFATLQRYDELPDGHWIARSYWRQGLLEHQYRGDKRSGIHLPGTNEDNLRLASSLVRSRSSAVRGTLGGFSFPPGHRPSRKIFKYDMILGSSSNDLIVSRIFLISPVSKAQVIENFIVTFQLYHQELVAE